MGILDPMNASEQIDYVFGQLEGADLAAFEKHLALDPAAAESIKRLSWAVDHLVDDGDSFAPPVDLATRTMAFVAESGRPKRTILDFVPVAVPYRWTDLAVAASIFFAAVLTLMPAVQRSRERMQQAGCANNLQDLGRALWQYDNLYKHYPNVNEKEDSAQTGIYAVILNDYKLIGDPKILDCPCNGTSPHSPLPNLKRACELSKTNPADLRVLLQGVEYAYNVVNLRPEDRAGRVQETASATLALLADQPNHRRFEAILPGNSGNHGGRGQNVVFSDLHVGWFNTRRISPDDADMFLNAESRPAPARNIKDAAMLPSFVPFRGW